MIASPGRATGLVAIDPVAIDRSWLDAVRRAVLEWYRREGRSFPFRGTTDPYLVLVSETILQQTQVSRGGPAWQAFTARFPTVESLAAASPADVLRAWQGLGYNLRAVRLHAIACHVVAEHRGVLPRSVAGLLSHWLEQLQNNRIYRPEQVYVGKNNVPYVPLGQRP